MVFGGVGFEIDTWIFDEGIEVLFSMGIGPAVCSECGL
jgi:hypothetical protein